ncbi:MAG: hypothetical protein JO144_11420 [Actinobacteria bacterium]|nr:hypothetical protein [Actinomycetota bacterium]
MTENHETGKLEEAAAEGPLPGAEEAEAAAEDGRDPSNLDSASRDPDAARDTSEDGQTDDDAPAGGVVTGAINQH